MNPQNYRDRCIATQHYDRNLGTFPGNESDSIQSGIFLSNTVFAACASQSGQVIFWDIENKKSECMFKHTETLTKVRTNRLEVKVI